MKNNGWYVIYARRSSESEDRQTLSIESQLEELRKFAATRGIEIGEELTESASARNPGRPVFNQLMKWVREGKVTGILTWRLDRLARNMVDGGVLIYELTRGTLKEIVTPEGSYTDTGDAKFALALQFGAASKYVDDLSAAVKRGNHRVLEDGKVPGPVPLGYMKTHEHELVPGSGTVIPDPERFDLVKRIWKEYLAGAPSVVAVWQKAREEWGLTTRPTAKTLARPIALTNVYHILRNPFYTGTIIRHGELFKGEHPPMVTEGEFDRVQGKLGVHDVHRSAPAHALHFLYQGMLHCGRCGRLMTGDRKVKRSGLVFTYYRCGRRHAGYQCHAPAPSEAQVTDAVLETLGRLRIGPAFQQWALQAVEWWAGKTELTPVSIVTKAKRELARAERQLATLTDLVVSENLTVEEYKVRRTNQLARIDHLREALAEPIERLEAWRAAKDELAHTGVNFAKAFQVGTDDDKRTLLARVFSDIIVTNRIPRPVLRVPFTLLAESGARTAAQPDDAYLQPENIGESRTTSSP